MSNSPRRTGSDAEILAALEGALQRRYQEEEARKAPPLGEHGGSSMQLCATSDCPFPHELLTRHFGFTGIPCARRSESRPIGRSESRPLEGGSFYALLI